MKTNYFMLSATALFLGPGAILSNCKKHDEKECRTFDMTSSTWYRFAPAAPAPVTVNGAAYTSFAYIPGGGTGTATDMGSITTFFNQLAFTNDATVPQPVILGSLTAPVSEAAGYAVTGGPLPLIQAADFNMLATANSSLQIPTKDASGNYVTSVVFNSSGDAIFTCGASTGIATVTPVSATRINYSGKASIAGGRGKFAGAVGEVDISGYFNPQNPNDAAYEIHGWIEY